MTAATTTTTTVGTLPATGDDTRDSAFFRITARLFSPAFCLRASVLLAGNDKAVEPRTPEPRTGTAAPTRVDVDARPERNLVPVRVRRTA